MAKQPPASTRVAAFEGDLDVFSIRSQWEKAQSLVISADGKTEVNFASVEDLDLSGIQLISALERDLRAKGFKLSMVGVMEAWKTRFALLGVARLFFAGVT